MARTKVFISHIHENAAIAKVLKQFVEKKFRGSVCVFASSDGDIPPGATWQEFLLTEIRESDLVIVVCTNASVHRPWVNFETGGALARGAQVIPVCWHGCRPSLLPLPLGALSALDLEAPGDVLRLLQAIAEHADMRVPEFNPAELIDALPKRYTESADLAPSMFLGLDVEPPEGLRLDAEYGVKRRRAMVKPYRRLNISIDRQGCGRLEVEEEVIYLEHQDSRTLKIFLLCEADQKFEDLDFHIQNASIMGWTKIRETKIRESVAVVSVRYNSLIPLLRPFRHKYSWIPPMTWGGDFDIISVPIEQPTGEQVLEVSSDLPIARAIAFKDIQLTNDSNKATAEAALHVTDSACPPASVRDGQHVSWNMELPEIQAVYRIVLFYRGGSYFPE